MQNSNFDKLVKTTRTHMNKDLDKYILQQCHEFVYNSMMQTAKEGSTVDYENPPTFYAASIKQLTNTSLKLLNAGLTKSLVKATLK